MSRFYVYALMHQDQVLYVGKGSGQRLRHQQRAFGLLGTILSRYSREGAAYRAEVKAISKFQPRLNRHPGGAGNWSTPKRRKRVFGSPAWYSRWVSARLVMRFAPVSCDPRIRHIACLTAEEARGL